MAKKSYIQATIDVISEEMRRDPDIFMIGEDIGELGGCFFDVVGLHKEFGDRRIMNAPISEQAIIGAGIGAAMAGLRPISQLMFVDFALVAMDQILNQAAKLRYMSGGQAKLPMVIRTQQGLGGNHSGQHSQSLEAIFMHVPGLKIVMPSSPSEVYGLLRTAIRDDNPVMFLDNKGFYYRNKIEEVSDDDQYLIPFGKARIVKEGTDVTIVATSITVQKALNAAEQLEKEGVSCEILDPRTLIPFDTETLINSIKKTGRLVVAHESVTVAGPGAEIESIAIENAFDEFKSAPVRVGAKYCTVPYCHVLEEAYSAQEKEIYAAVRKTMKG